MSDDFSRELEEIAKLFPNTPGGLSELRALIASLPAPSLVATPDIQTTQLPDTETQTAELSAGPVSTAGVAGGGTSAPGSISGGSIIPGTLQAAAFSSSIRPIQMVDGPDLPTLPDANFPDSAVIFNQDDGRFYRNELGVWHTFIPETGPSNIVPDPTFETAIGKSISNTEIDNGFWRQKLVVASGSVSSNGYFDDLYDRLSTEDNPFSSEIMELDSGSGTGAYDHTVWVRSDEYQMMGTYMSDLPYVVAAIQFMDWGPWSSVEADYSAIEAILQIYTVLGNLAGGESSIVVEAETVVDVKTLPADLPVQAWVACYRDPLKYYGIRFGLRVAKNATAGSGGWMLGVGEPQIHLSGTPDPAAFTPAIGNWVPDTLRQYTGSNQNYATFRIGGGGSFTWAGTGNQDPDLYMARGSAKQLYLTSWGASDAELLVQSTIKATGAIYGATGGNDNAFYVGDDAIIADIDQGNTLAIIGQQDPTQGKLVLGNNKDVRLFRDGYRTLHIDGGDGWFARITGSLVGWTRYAYPHGFDPAGTYTTGYNLDAGTSSVVFVEVYIPAKMTLKSVSIWNTDTTGTRGFQWAMYAQPWGSESNNLTMICFSVGGTSWTASAGSLRTVAIDGAPVFLPQGTYWLAIWNNQAGNTLGIGTAATGTLALTRARKKTTVAFGTQPVDFLAATWTDSTSIFAAVLNGDAAPSAQQFLYLPLAESLPVAYDPVITHKVRTITLPLIQPNSWVAPLAFPLIVEHA